MGGGACRGGAEPSISCGGDFRAAEAELRGRNNKALRLAVLTLFQPAKLRCADLGRQLHGLLMAISPVKLFPEGADELLIHLRGRGSFLPYGGNTVGCGQLLAGDYLQIYKVLSGQHGGGGQPLQGGGGGAKQLGRHGAFDGVYQPAQARGGIFPGGAHDELFPGAGHGHIQNAHFLAEAFLLYLPRNGPAGQSGILHAAVAVCQLGAETQLRMYEHMGLGVGFVEAVSKVAEEHKGKLKALALVDAHNGDEVAFSVSWGLLPPLGHTAQPRGKAEKTSVAALLEGAGQLKKTHEISSALVASAHG